MKKIISLAAAILITLVGITSCGAKPEPVDVNVMALKGPTAMGMVKFMKDVEDKKIEDNNYSFKIASSIDEVTPALVKGDVDIAAVPANMASVLYNTQNKNIQVLGVNTLGVIYICETGDSVKSVSDLKGKTIYASGKGATPEYALNYILEGNGLKPGVDVKIEWKSEHAECVAAIAKDKNAIAMLPQPFVAAAQVKNPNIKVALDLTKEWDTLQKEKDDSTLITGVVVARKDFVEKNPEAVNVFLENYKKSVEFVNKNTADAAKLIGEFDIVPAKVAEKALPQCNIVLLTGDEMEDKLSGYLEILAKQNPKAIGGKVPGDDFYFGAED